ncbi:hypothetical protein [Pasteuria penetrans]|uniref:hypothetical protein n=1 Tax=Pasteuria penetrans TaxID=86005 RepID=UPI000F9398AA|nr:hypothetical protein [Pasteuria penetrans]
MEKENYRVDLTNGAQRATIQRVEDVGGRSRDIVDTEMSFLVSATKEEIAELDTLFKQAEKADVATFGMAQVPFLSSKTFESYNQRADYALDRIYERLHALGVMNMIASPPTVVDSPGPGAIREVKQNMEGDSTTGM